MWEGMVCGRECVGVLEGKKLIYTCTENYYDTLMPRRIVCTHTPLWIT